MMIETKLKAPQSAAEIKKEAITGMWKDLQEGDLLISIEGSAAELMALNRRNLIAGSYISGSFNLSAEKDLALFAYDRSNHKAATALVLHCQGRDDLKVQGPVRVSPDRKPMF